MRLLDALLESDVDYLKNNLNSTNFNETVKGGNFAIGLPCYTDPCQVAYYMLKYAKFYALEYYWMYDLILRLLNADLENRNIYDAPVVYSFGCGSMVDGLSLLYAHKKLHPSMERIGSKPVYRGIDIVNWPNTGMVFDGSVQEYAGDICISKYFGVGMEEFWTTMNDFYANVLFFPKLLSENLDDHTQGASVLDKFCEEIRNAKLTKEYIILAFSYRGTNTFSSDNQLAQRIVDAMIEKGYKKEPYRGSAIINNWICKDYFSLVDNENMIFESRVPDVDYSRFPDFMIPPIVDEYMNKGGVLVGNCPGNVTDTEVCSHRSVIEICEECNNRCKTRSMCRKKLKSVGGQSCIQILPLRRRNEQ